MTGPIPFVFSDINNVRYEWVLTDGSDTVPSAYGVSQHNGKYLVDINASVPPNAISVILTDTSDPTNVTIWTINTNPTADQIAQAVKDALQNQFGGTQERAYFCRDNEVWVEECHRERMGHVISAEVPR